MRFQAFRVLLLWLSACATSAPDPKAQVAIPVGPLVAPKPMTIPVPMGLGPPAPLVVVPEDQPGPRQESSPERDPAPALTAEHRPECVPQRVPHLGGDALHNACADNVPRNDFRGSDVLVNGKRFDALQLGTRVLWEVKTDNFGTYSDALQEMVLRSQLVELQRERDLAISCGFNFRVGVRSAAHGAALREVAPLLDIVVMDW